MDLALDRNLLEALMLKRGEGYQYLLIGLAALSTVLFGFFFARELFPEYKIYQKAYVELEEFRAEEIGSTPPPFRFGVKQIVLSKLDKGPETIDRCTSCHVALELSHFSKTTLAKDVNGEQLFDEFGVPVQVPNPDYIFAKLAAKIEALEKEGTPKALEEAKRLQLLTSMDKVLAMHPLIGKETRPFQFHPMEEYGCTVCHGGDGSALTAERAHGPVFDGTYEEAFMGPEPQFLEIDPENDPPFSKVFNSKPGHRLLYQTTPILVGNLIEASCVKCHKPSDSESGGNAKEYLENEYSAVIALLSMRSWLIEQGSQETLQKLKESANNYNQPKKELDKIAAQIQFLAKKIDENEGNVKKEEKILASVDQELRQLVRSDEALKNLEEAFKKNRDVKFADVKSFLRGEERFFPTSFHKELAHFSQGEFLYLSQACYACHRIQGFARGGVGPELSQEGLVYPWFIKESIVWPQSDLKTSTMPNFRLDHDELEDLMTFLLAQRPDILSFSETEKRKIVKDWEEGKKLPFEEPLPAASIRDVESSMRIFATEGCAACHRLEGYRSQVAFKSEEESDWFRKNFPEDALGLELKEAIESLAEEIDKRTVVHEKLEILDELERDYPGLIESFYSPFKFALRAKNHLPDSERIPYQERARKVLMLFASEYGLGRLIGPRPNWSGIFRSVQWLMEHFANPSQLSPRSIMPVFPFDQTKFLALTYMLNAVAKENRNLLRAEWKESGFSPEIAYDRLCSQCHGDQMKGNGPVSEWIYPIPKNLTNPIFMRNLTKEQAIISIRQGVKGTPMPPWGVVADQKEDSVLTDEEIVKLVDWLYSNLPGEQFIKSEEESRKWNYFPPHADELFDKVPSTGEERYFIKRKYYTEENLAAGEAFFELNCAVCHGNDADGAGVRSEVMEDAKPRMLINFPWIQTRDDMRLLRSINFGVQGTSMVAWGEATTPLQRLQLVMYIRSLTDKKRSQEIFANKMYSRYQRSLWNIEDAKRDLPEEKDFTGLSSLVKREQQLISELGSQLFIRFGDSKTWLEFNALLSSDGAVVEWNGKELKIDPWNKDISPLLQSIQESIAKAKQQIAIEKGKIESSPISLQSNLAREEESIKEVESTFAEVKLIREKMIELTKEMGNGKESH